MLKAVVDTNVKFAGMLSNHISSASRELMRSLPTGEFILIESVDTMEELRRILSQTASRAPFNWSADRVDQSIRLFAQFPKMIHAPSVVSPTLPRDITDAKFLDLALAADADYLVTNDRRHLLPLKKIGRTKIVTPHKFLTALKRA